METFAIVKSNKLTSGCGPEDLPPIVLSLAPAGLTLVTSKDGILPSQRFFNKDLYAVAHPDLESSTTITSDVFSKVSGIEGSLWEGLC